MHSNRLKPISSKFDPQLLKIPGVSEGLKKFFFTRITDGSKNTANSIAKSFLNEKISPGTVPNLDGIFREVIGSGQKNAREERARHLAQHFIQLVPAGLNVESFLDCGCGKGLLTRLITQELGLRQERAYGIDIETHPNLVNDGHCTFKKVPDGNWIGIPNSSIDLLTINMVMHHCEDPFSIISEARRTVRPYGVVVIRDHDASSPQVAVIAELIEDVMDLVRGTQRTQEAANDNYQRYQYWIDVFESADFELIRLIEPLKTDPYKSFSAVFLRNATTAQEAKIPMWYPS